MAMLTPSGSRQAVVHRALRLSNATIEQSLAAIPKTMPGSRAAAADTHSLGAIQSGLQRPPPHTLVGMGA